MNVEMSCTLPNICFQPYPGTNFISKTLTIENKNHNYLSFVGLLLISDLVVANMLMYSLPDVILFVQYTIPLGTC